MATLPELVQRIRTQSPAVIGKLDDKFAVRLLRTAFDAIVADVEKSPDGAVKVGGLGVFRVRTTPVNAEGKGGGRRVMFQPKKPKAAATAKSK